MHPDDSGCQRYATEDDRIGFATQIGYFFRQMQPAAIQQLWDNWLRGYWHARLQGVLAPLEEAETREMLESLPCLASAPSFQLDHSRVLFALADSELVTTHQNETAELLIYICKGNVGYHAIELAAVALRLFELEPELQYRLDDSLARVGAIRR